MSAVSVAIAPGGKRGFMLSDCALYDSNDGIFQGFASKAFTLPHAGAVIAARGPMALCAWVAGVAQVYGDFDAIQDNLQEALVRSLPAIRAFVGHGDAEVFVLGYSEREKRVKAIFAASDSATPFAMEGGPLLFGPNVDNEELTRLRFPNASQVRADNTALPRGLLNVIQYQRDRAIAEREAAAKAGTATTAEVIGGAAILTTISENEITQRVFYRWPDIIGQPITSSSPIAA